MSQIRADLSLSVHTGALDASNALTLLKGHDIILDGTDNFSTRFLISDASRQLQIPWIYGGVVATQGMVMSYLPWRTPCFRCMIPHLPEDGTYPTTDRAGVISTIVMQVASLQCNEALKIIMGKEDELISGLVSIDLWRGEWRILQLPPMDNCPLCKEGRFEFL